ncbi:hypothetical protein HA466_0001200 [Hirschfeldia incana]|nr:hypothetical protein HA466_0001200 [Hirschfeldia incana]
MLPEKKNSTSVVLPCIDKLRDELSCAIYLEIFEPSTTTCGHSFWKCFVVCSGQVWKEMPQMQTAKNMGGGGSVDKEGYKSWIRNTSDYNSTGSMYGGSCLLMF